MGYGATDESRWDRFRLWWIMNVYYCRHSSGDVFFGFKIYGTRNSDKLWFRWTVLPLYRVALRFHGARLWFYYRFTKDGRSCWQVIPTLTPGYYDVDYLILESCFALLGRYIEEEGGLERLKGHNIELREHIDPHAPPGLQEAQAKEQDEAVTLYEWWTVERPRDIAECDRLRHLLYGGKSRMTSEPVEGSCLSRLILEPFSPFEESTNERFRKLEEKIESDEQTMLHRLISIRGRLWS